LVKLRDEFLQGAECMWRRLLWHSLFFSRFAGLVRRIYACLRSIENQSMSFKFFLSLNQSNKRKNDTTAKGNAIINRIMNAINPYKSLAGAPTASNKIICLFFLAASLGFDAGLGLFFTDDLITSCDRQIQLFKLNISFIELLR
jgi:hypothetical protein